MPTPPAQDPKTFERRYTAEPIELRTAGNAQGDGEPTSSPPKDQSQTALPSVRGYAALFDTPSDDLGGFIERIARGAFDEARMEAVVALFNHNPDILLARAGSTLTLGTDERGLWYEFTPPNSPDGQNLVESLRRGDLTQSSFAFRIAEDGEQWEQGEGTDGKVQLVRTITKVRELFDVSPVTYPAYRDTSVALRSLENFRRSVSAPNDAGGSAPAEDSPAQPAPLPAHTIARLGLSF